MSEKEENCKISTPLNKDGEPIPAKAKIECGLTHINRQTLEWLVTNLDEIEQGNMQIKDAVKGPYLTDLDRSLYGKTEDLAEQMASKAKWTAEYLRKAFRLREKEALTIEETKVEM